MYKESLETFILPVKQRLPDVICNAQLEEMFKVKFNFFIKKENTDHHVLSSQISLFGKSHRFIKLKPLVKHKMLSISLKIFQAECILDHPEAVVLLFPN